MFVLSVALFKIVYIYLMSFNVIWIAGGDIQCIRKVFRPLDFFYILLRYSLLKLITFFPLIDLHTIPHNDKAKFGKFIKLNSNSKITFT